MERASPSSHPSATTPAVPRPHGYPWKGKTRRGGVQDTHQDGTRWPKTAFTRPTRYGPRWPRNFPNIAPRGHKPSNLRSLRD
eukprot:2974402-Pyramimonas_sp.AAC.1